MITMQMLGEIENMNKQVRILKIQETYQILKGITMRKYIDKQQLPEC
jgi:hypothetical protein